MTRRQVMSMAVAAPVWTSVTNLRAQSPRLLKIGATTSAFALRAQPGAGATAFDIIEHTEDPVDFLRQPTGKLVGAGIRWQPWPQLALAVGGSYLPDDAGTEDPDLHDDLRRLRMDRDRSTDASLDH